MIGGRLNRRRVLVLLTPARPELLRGADGAEQHVIDRGRQDHLHELEQVRDLVGLLVVGELLDRHLDLRSAAG